MALDTTYSLITVEELKIFLDGDEGGYPVDVDMTASLEMTIDGVSRWMHEYTGRQLKSAAVTEYYNGDGSTHLYLHSWPITASDIRIDSDHTFGTSSEITPNIITDSEVYYSGGFPVGHRNIKAVYTAGYTTIPSDLKLACLQMCQISDRAQKKGVGGVGQVSIAGTNIQLHVEKLAPPMVMNVLSKYQRVFL